jgi:hypothetical protein
MYFRVSAACCCNSDLKNTYGMIKVDYSGRMVNTNMQFFGCVIGDYSKTAINTTSLICDLFTSMLQKGTANGA